MTSESFPPSGIDENFLCRALADVLVTLIVAPRYAIRAVFLRRKLCLQWDLLVTLVSYHRVYNSSRFSE